MVDPIAFLLETNRWRILRQTFPDLGILLIRLASALIARFSMTMASPIFSYTQEAAG